MLLWRKQQQTWQCLRGENRQRERIKERANMEQIQNGFLQLSESAEKEITETMPPEEEMNDLADFFRIFGDATRLKILYALKFSEMCVLDIAQLLGMSQSAISHQLRILKQSRLVKFRREGKTIYYSLADDHVATIMAQGLEHVCE